MPMMALKAVGVECAITDDPTAVPLDDRTEAVVLVKAFNFKTMRLAFECRARGIPLVLDLCDNIFVEAYSEHFDGFQLSSCFKAIAAFATVLVTTSPTLAEQLREVVGEHLTILQCNDGIESREDILGLLEAEAEWNRTKSGKAAAATAEDDLDAARPLSAKIAKALGNPRWAAGRLRDLLDSRLRPGRVNAMRAKLAVEAANDHAAKHAPRALVAPPATATATVSATAGSATSHRLGWFGIHGSTHGDFGIATLLKVVPDLITLGKELDIVLVVISNSVERFNEYIKPLPLRTEYIEWDPIRIFDDLKGCAVCLIPNSLDEFSIGKSSNRHTFSLSLGVPVVATYTAVLEPLRGCMLFDGWYEGIRSYLLDPQLRQRHLAMARQVMRRNHSQAALAIQWNEVVSLCHSRDPRKAVNSRTTLVFMDLIQDVDLCLPLIREALVRPGVGLRVCITRLLAATSPRALQLLREAGVEPEIVERGHAFKGSAPKLLGVMALVTAVESTQPAHRTAHALVKRARAAGIKTYTLQHGFENVGLNYFEGKEDLGVEFASDVIFTWGSRSVVPGKTPVATLAKCVPVGMVKAAGGESGGGLVIPRQGFDAVVAVFENLHWNRYREKFRMAFLEQLMATIAGNPKILFLIKPHHAGRWFTKNVVSSFKSGPNSLVMDPLDSRWEPFTAPKIITNSDLIITTPSTVALDAAALGVPVAVFAEEMSLPAYQPLPMLSSQADWTSFISAALDSSHPYRALGHEFFNKTVCREQAAATILDHIISPGSVSSAPEPAVAQTATDYGRC
jgi:hypothetical protein